MKKCLVALIVGLMLVSSQAFALPVSMSNLSLFTTTSNLEGTSQSNTTMFYLVEASNHAVVPVDASGRGLRVDILAPLASAYSGASLNSGAATAHYIPVGTVINSYFIHFDKLDTSTKAVLLSASLTFGSTEQILGIMTSTTSQNISDEYLGVPGFTYYASSGNASSLETRDDRLEWTLNADGTTTLNLGLTLSSNSEIDAVRVITAGGAAPVPEPATMLLLGTGLIGLAGFGRRKLFKRR